MSVAAFDGRHWEEARATLDELESTSERT